VTDKERSARFGQKPVTLWLSGAKRSSLAYALERSLFDLGHAAMVLDDHNCQTQRDAIAEQICRAGLICICTLDNSGTRDAACNIDVAADSMTVEVLLQQLRTDHILLT
jgi:bifunctional enzyme CysN/CysC